MALTRLIEKFGFAQHDKWFWDNYYNSIYSLTFPCIAATMPEQGLEQCNKKRRETLLPYVHKTEASPNALTEWTVKKQYSHAVIYTWDCAPIRAHNGHIYTEWALIASVLCLKFWRNFCFGLKQNAFLRQWIYYMKPLSLGKANKFSLPSLTRCFLTINNAKIVQTSKTQIYLKVSQRV